MSLRKMLKVSLLMLLAMALAATSAHARLDLFGQLRTSMNQPNPNSGDDKKVVLWTKANSDRIPYYECIETCEACVCDRRAPEFAMCICRDNIKSKNLAAAVQEVESSSSKAKSDCGKNTASNSKKPAIQNLGDDKKVVLWTKANSDRIPYYECIETCEACVCDKRLPEFAMCTCGDNIKSKNPVAAVQEVESSSSKAKSDYTASNSKKPALQNLGDDKKVVLWTKANSDQIPYYECIETCEACVCDRRAPEFAMCICVDPKAAGRALPI